MESHRYNLRGAKGDKSEKCLTGKSSVRCFGIFFLNAICHWRGYYNMILKEEALD